MKKILIVEDESAIRETISEILQFSTMKLLKPTEKLDRNRQLDLIQILVICEWCGQDEWDLIP